jgi:uncharacterized protein (TIGR03437 family)
VRILSSSVFLAAALAFVSGQAFSQAPVVSNGGVFNAASYAPSQAVAPGSLIAIFGTNLASSLAVADTVPFSVTLNSVGVTVNGASAPLQFVSSGQVNAQLPWTTATGTASIVVSRSGTASAPVSFQVGAAAPGIFTLPGNGLGQAIAYGNSDGAFAAPAGAVSAPYTSHPAKIGDPATLVILATGLGAVDPPVANGSVPGPGVLSNTVMTPTVLVGNVAAKVVFSGHSPYVGVYQINIVIQPGTPTGDKVPLQLVMNGITTSNQVTIAVSN